MKSSQTKIDIALLALSKFCVFVIGLTLCVASNLFAAKPFGIPSSEEERLRFLKARINRDPLDLKRVVVAIPGSRYMRMVDGRPEPMRGEIFLEAIIQGDDFYSAMLSNTVAASKDFVLPPSLTQKIGSYQNLAWMMSDRLLALSVQRGAEGSSSNDTPANVTHGRVQMVSQILAMGMPEIERESIVWENYSFKGRLKGSTNSSISGLVKPSETNSNLFLVLASIRRNEILTEKRVEVEFKETSGIDMRDMATPSSGGSWTNFTKILSYEAGSIDVDQSKCNPRTLLGGNSQLAVVFYTNGVQSSVEAGRLGRYHSFESAGKFGPVKIVIWAVALACIAALVFLLRMNLNKVKNKA